MEPDVIPAPLADRLGADATDGLRHVLQQLRIHVREDAISVCTERFERRLVEEISGVRVQIAQVESSIRQDMTRLGADVRGEMAALRSELRGEMAVLGSDLRGEMGALGSNLRGEMGLLRSHAESARVDLLKWAFIFWIGQVAATATVVGVIVGLAR